MRFIRFRARDFPHSTPAIFFDRLNNGASLQSIIAPSAIGSPPLHRRITAH
ncbi:hypothetical protein C7S16_4892 [Burkholderia thailandensis]|uniref:Uncharacterized protein n=1 Tax=Burkholderia thailandensis TaxID=57975 RepID=A0AAW9CRV9_BURTH|nr:hypothetical protein [Burkholderia thailandensis]MDW9251803.1 hypothetical protein [Burkholderia thailandensis]